MSSASAGRTASHDSDQCWIQPGGHVSCLDGGQGGSRIVDLGFNDSARATRLLVLSASLRP